MRDKLEIIMEELNPSALFADGFDDAIVGYSRRIGLDYIICYSYPKAIEILIGDGMEHGEAIEYMEFNVVGGYVGENTPIFIESFEI